MQPVQWGLQCPSGHLNIIRPRRQRSKQALSFYTSIQISPIDSSYLAEFVVDGPGDQRGLAHPGVSEEDHAAQLPAAVAAVHPHRERERWDRTARREIINVPNLH